MVSNKTKDRKYGRNEVGLERKVETGVGEESRLKRRVLCESL